MHARKSSSDEPLKMEQRIFFAFHEFISWWPINYLCNISVTEDLEFSPNAYLLITFNNDSEGEDTENKIRLVVLD